MTEHTQLLASDPIEDEVRAAFTERIHAEVARLIADSLAARARTNGTDPGALGAVRRMHRDAEAHDQEAHRHEKRVALLRQLAHDGRL